MDASGPNAEQITYWNEQTGQKWVAVQARLDAMIAPFGDAAMAALGPRPGKRLIDVGCGCGTTTLALAERVTPSGSVLGVDVSEPMLARAREVAAARGVDHVRFVAADAQVHAFPEGGSDGVFSRFGVMFFADPTAAFANLSRALVPGGRVAFACWQALFDNAWIRVPMMALGAIMPLPPPPPPDAPGPGAFADRERVTGILERAGLRDVHFESFTPDVVLSGDGGIDEAVRFALEIGPTSRAIADAPPDLKVKAAAALAEAFAPHASARGVVLPSAAWIVTARR